jgi:predicted MFS family arabinose efflux permease
LVASLVANGWSERAGALILAFGNAVGIGGRVLAGVLADRLTVGHFGLIAAMLSFGGVGLALLASGSATALVIGITLMYLAGWSWPGILQHSVIRTVAVDPAQVTGVIQVGPFVGGALGPVLFAQLLSHSGYPEAWIAAAAAAVGGGLVVLAGSARLGRSASGLGSA